MGRAPCCDNAGDRNKGAWTKEEDDKLVRYIQIHGEGCWRSLPKAAGLLRCGKSCRLRWINYLRPDLKRGNFSEDEEDLIFKLHALLGNKWSLIAGRLPGRTDNEIKNYWNSHLKRKLISRGVDPLNHRPFHMKSADTRRPSTQVKEIAGPQTQEEGNKCSCDTTVDNVSESRWEQQEVTSERDFVPNLNLELSITCPPSTNNQSKAPPAQSKQDTYPCPQTLEDGQNAAGGYEEMPRTMLLLR